MIREWLRLLLNRPQPRPNPPLPANWNEWSPLAKDIWHAINTFPFDPADIDAAVERHR